VPKRRPERKRATLRELSQITGLSPAGVSYALRGQRVSAETEARVRKEAERIGFRSDPIARALRGGRTELVGVVGGSLAAHWHQQFVWNLQRSLRRHGLRVVLADAGGDHLEELALAADLAARRVDGLIVLPIDPAGAGWRPIVEGTPTVSVNASLQAPAGAIRFDAHRGIELALEHLAALGHRRILVLGGGPHAVPRRPGVVRRRCGFSSGEARAAVLPRLRSATPPSAVFALSDSIAYGVYEACRELGIEVPAQLSVAGFDDNPISRLLDPALTAVGWDTAGAATAAADMLAAAIEGEPGGEVVIEPRLWVRASTAAPA
jgi:LacI family transcriptional regulator